MEERGTVFDAICLSYSYLNKTGKTLGSSRDCFDSDDYCDTTTYAKDGYRFTISLYYYASSDRVTFSVGCSNETEEFYKRSS